MRGATIVSKEHLATYLNDHLAGSLVAAEILDHLEVEAPDLKVFISELRADIAADRQQLKGLMDRLNIPESRIRKVSGWIAEQVTEAKLEVDDESNGQFRRLERLEALALGIDGKIALWQALSQAAELDAQLRGLDYEALARRGRDQHSRTEVFRLQAARLALPHGIK